MQELSLEIAKEIVIEPVPDMSGMTSIFYKPGRAASMLKFTRLLMASEVYTINEIDKIQKECHDLSHLAGVHKFPKRVAKADETRWFWTQLWREDNVINQVKGLKQYIIDVCEASAFRAGHATRPYGLFLGYGGSMRHHNHPWRTAEWYEERRPIRIPFQPLTEFYPYISVTPTEDHDLLLAVDRLVPKGLNPDTRADVCQDMLVAVLSGEVTLDNLAGERPKYMKQFFKMFPTKYGHLSLDMPLSFGGDEMNKTLAETIAAEYR